MIGLAQHLEHSQSAYGTRFEHEALRRVGSAYVQSVNRLQPPEPHSFHLIAEFGNNSFNPAATHKTLGEAASSEAQAARSAHPVPAQRFVQRTFTLGVSTPLDVTKALQLADEIEDVAILAELTRNAAP